MAEFLTGFGAIAFIAIGLLILAFIREYNKLKLENTQLHKDYEAIIQLVPTISSEELETLKTQIIESEETNTCQKS